MASSTSRPFLAGVNAQPTNGQGNLCRGPKAQQDSGRDRSVGPRPNRAITSALHPLGQRSNLVITFAIHLLVHRPNLQLFLSAPTAQPERGPKAQPATARGNAPGCGTPKQFQAPTGRPCRPPAERHQSHTYRSSNGILCRSNSARNSSWNDCPR
jgi:hypothetical protein